MTIDTKKLRRLSKALTPGPTPSHYGIIGRAADRIDALEADNKRLREALQGAWTLIAQLPPTQDRVEVARMVCAALAKEQS